MSHSVGAMPLALHAAKVDMAVGCTYKYLNGGPGAPAFLYVRKDLQEQLLSPIWGWFGQKEQFDMALNYQPAAGLTRFLAGTPTILSLSAVEPSVDLILEAGIDRLREKSVRQTEYLIGLWEETLRPLGVKLNSPRDATCRGSHVSLGHPEGLRIDRALIEEMHVIPDFRYPDNIRFGIAPLYTSFADIHEAMARLRRVLVGASCLKNTPRRGRTSLEDSPHPSPLLVGGDIADGGKRAHSYSQGAKKTLLAGCSKTYRYKASEIPRAETYIPVRRKDEG